MLKYLQKSWTATRESLQQLSDIAKYLGDSNMSNSIRWCISQQWKHLKDKNLLPTPQEREVV